MLSAVYPPSLPLAFSLSALLALSCSWLSVLPVLAFASPFRPLPSPAVCHALPSLLLAGALRLRPPVRRPQLRRSRRWRLLAKPGLSSSCSSFASGGRTTTSFPCRLTAAGQLEIPPAPGFEVRRFCHGERRRKAREEVAVVSNRRRGTSVWRREYSRSSPATRPP